MINQHLYYTGLGDYKTFEAFLLQPQTPPAQKADEWVPLQERRLEYSIDEALGFQNIDWSQLSKPHPRTLDPWRPIEQR